MEPGIPVQAGAGCLLQLPPHCHTAGQEGMLEQAQVLQGGDADSFNAAVCAQAFLLCPATPRDHFVFFTLSPKRFLSLKIC